MLVDQPSRAGELHGAGVAAADDALRSRTPTAAKFVSPAYVARQVVVPAGSAGLNATVPSLAVVPVTGCSRPVRCSVTVAPTIGAASTWSVSVAVNVAGRPALPEAGARQGQRGRGRGGARRSRGSPCERRGDRERQHEPADQGGEVHVASEKPGRARSLRQLQARGASRRSPRVSPVARSKVSPWGFVGMGGDGLPAVPRPRYGEHRPLVGDRSCSCCSGWCCSRSPRGGSCRIPSGCRTCPLVGFLVWLPTIVIGSSQLGWG